MLAAWEEYARGAVDAAVRRLPGVTAGVFPCGPERAFYNNALLERDLGAAERADAVGAMEAAYTAGGVTRFAAWVHESDAPMRGDLEQRGFTLQETTRAMGMALDDIRLPRPGIELAPADWSEYLRASGFPPGLLAGADPARFRRPRRASRRPERRRRAGVRSRFRLRDLQRRHPGARPAARPGHGPYDHRPPRCARPRMRDGERPVDRDGRGRVRRRRLPGSGPVLRVRATGRGRHELTLFGRRDRWIPRCRCARGLAILRPCRGPRQGLSGSNGRAAAPRCGSPRAWPSASSPGSSSHLPPARRCSWTGSGSQSSWSAGSAPCRATRRAAARTGWWICGSTTARSGRTWSIASPRGRSA